MVTLDDLGIRFHFDRHRRVVTPNASRLRRGSTTAWGLRHVTSSFSAGEGVAQLARDAGVLTVRGDAPFTFSADSSARKSLPNVINP